MKKRPVRFEVPVIDIIPRAYNVKSFRFPRPEDFEYKAGQYFFIYPDADIVPPYKPFTISSSPAERTYLEFTKKLTGHEFSNMLDNLKIGDTVGIEGPFGRLTFSGEYDRIALISGGIGITPMISICRYCTRESRETDVILLSSNRTVEDIIFFDELEQMQLEDPNLKVVHTLTRPDEDWPGCTGRICDDMIVANMPDFEERVFYICGPPPMMDATISILEGLGVSGDRIKKESFGI